MDKKVVNIDSKKSIEWNGENMPSLVFSLLSFLFCSFYFWQVHLSSKKANTRLFVNLMQ